MEKLPLKQLERVRDMTTPIGMVQHSKDNTPDVDSKAYHAYSIDDSARALTVVSRFPNWDNRGIHKYYLNFIERAQREDRLFNNYQDSNGNPLQEDEGLLKDCFGRTIWGLAEFVKSKNSHFSKENKNRASRIIENNLSPIDFLDTPHSIAFATIAISKYNNSKLNPYLRELSDKLAKLYESNSDEGWSWFSEKLTYCNARLPQAMLLSGDILRDERLLEIGRKSLDFLTKNSFHIKDKRDIFNAVGNKGWFGKADLLVPLYDQQPVEAGCMAETCSEAARIFSDEKYLALAKNAFDWYHGKNINSVDMRSPQGGIYDGIIPEGINTNQGAESVLSYLMGFSKIN